MQRIPSKGYDLANSQDTVMSLDIGEATNAPRKSANSPPTRPMRAIARGKRHSLAIHEGQAYSWGESALEEEGEVFVAHLGHGEQWGARVETPTPLAGQAGISVVEVAAGNMHSLVLSSDGQVYSCGAGWEGALGHGHEGCVPRLEVVRALAGVRITQVAAGGSHSLAVSADGDLYSWGWGRHGQLGHGDFSNRLIPTPVRALVGTRVVHVAAGTAHSIVVTSSGQTYSFGKGDDGQAAVPAFAHHTPRHLKVLSGPLVQRVAAAAAGIRERSRAAHFGVSASLPSATLAFEALPRSHTVAA